MVSDPVYHSLVLALTAYAVHHIITYANASFEGFSTQISRPHLSWRTTLTGMFVCVAFRYLSLQVLSGSSFLHSDHVILLPTLVATVRNTGVIIPHGIFSTLDTAVTTLRRSPKMDLDFKDITT